MASESLLEKEKKYYAINSELERETAELLKKADMVLVIKILTELVKLMLYC